MIKTTIDTSEVAKFAQQATQWWNKEGPLKTLHDINPARIEFIRQFTPLGQQSLLDVGCGGGILSEGLAKAGALVTGVDVEPDTIAAATAHAATQKLEITYIFQPIEYLKRTPVDIVVCMEMLEHVSDPQQVINHCARLLKSGGYLFLSTINRTMKAYASAIIAAEYLLALLPRQTHDFDKFIKVSELSAMTRAAGFETVGISGMAYNPFTRIASLQSSIDVNYLMACRKL